jgi:hypothetical protein
VGGGRAAYPGGPMRRPLHATPLAPIALAPSALVTALATLLAACEGTTSLVGPRDTQLVATTGGAFTVGGLAGESLLGRWTRVEGAGPGVIVETTFSFLSGGTGARVVVTRTALGAVIAEDRQPFTWTAGAGVLVLRIAGALGETVLRASFAVEQDLTGATLRLDGLPYRRSS